MQHNIKELVASAEKWVEENIHLGLGLLDGAEHIIIAYFGPGLAEAAAYTAYWFLRVLAPSLWVEVHAGENVTYHILAYQEEERVEKTRIVVFAEEGLENNLMRLLEAAKLTGVKALIVSPPLPPVIESRIPEVHVRLRLGSNAPLEAVIYAARLGFEYARSRGEKSRRTDRLGGEVSNYSEVVDELTEKYKEFIQSIKSIREGRVVVAYTPTMRPPACMLRTHLRYDKGVNAIALPISSLIWQLAAKKPPETLVLAYTDVEDDTIKEAKFKSMMLMPSKQPKIVELRLKTDPLTAPVYGVILVETIKRTM